ncbi:MAG: hypothetical protein ACREX0_02895 [Noviherbaspirillum sp.]
MMGPKEKGAPDGLVPFVFISCFGAHYISMRKRISHSQYSFDKKNAFIAQKVRVFVEKNTSQLIFIKRGEGT